MHVTEVIERFEEFEDKVVFLEDSYELWQEVKNVIEGQHLAIELLIERVQLYEDLAGDENHWAKMKKTVV